MKRSIYLLAVLFFLVMSTTANAQVTGTRLINKSTLTSGNYSGTLTYLYTDRTGTDIGVRKVTAPDILDFAGLGTTDVVTHGGAILNGNLTVTGTGVLAGTLTLSGGLISTSATISQTLGVLGRLSVGTATATNFLTLYNPTTNSDLVMSVDGTSFSSGTRFRGFRFYDNGNEKGAMQYKYAAGTETIEVGAQGAIGVGVYNNGAYRLWITPTGNSGFGTTSPHSTLQIAGSIASSLRATAASGNITATDHVVTGTGSITLTLPTAASITGREYIVKNIGGGSITAASAGGTIDGVSTQTIVTGTGAISSMKFKSDGTNWIITY
jgi:hypothetical protein